MLGYCFFFAVSFFLSIRYIDCIIVVAAIVTVFFLKKCARFHRIELSQLHMFGFATTLLAWIICAIVYHFFLSLSLSFYLHLYKKNYASSAKKMDFTFDTLSDRNFTEMRIPIKITSTICVHIKKLNLLNCINIWKKCEINI